MERIVNLAKDLVINEEDLIKEIEAATQVFVFTEIYSDATVAIQVVKEDLIREVKFLTGGSKAKVYDCHRESWDDGSTYLYVGW